MSGGAVSEMRIIVFIAKVLVKKGEVVKAKECISLK